VSLKIFVSEITSYMCSCLILVITTIMQPCIITYDNGQYSSLIKLSLEVAANSVTDLSRVVIRGLRGEECNYLELCVLTFLASLGPCFTHGSLDNI